VVDDIYCRFNKNGGLVGVGLLLLNFIVIMEAVIQGIVYIFMDSFINMVGVE
jgi:hypothetical protein